jgi:Histidine kinase-like ATPase domain
MHDLPTRETLVEHHVRQRALGGADVASAQHDAVAMPAHHPDDADRELTASEAAEVRRWLHDEPLQLLECLARDASCRHELRSAAGRTACELRSLVDGSLRVPRAATELLAGLCSVVRAAGDAMDADVRLRIGRVERSVTGEPAHALVSAVREALTNVAKHAQATSVEVHCDVSHERTSIRVVDDGVGFNPQRIDRGFGVRQSIIGRLERLGHTRIVAGVGRGTVVEMVVEGDRMDEGGCA